jgi:chromosome segregation ATPase
LEVQRGKLGDMLVVIGQRLSTVESELSTSTAKLDNILKIGYDAARIQIRKVEHQISTLDSEAQEAIKEKIALEGDLSKLEDSKEELARSVLTARKESKKFTDQ